MTTTKTHKLKPKRRFDQLKTTLVLGSLVATLVGTNLMSGEEWLASVTAEPPAIMAFPIPDKRELQAIPTVVALSSPPEMEPPSVPSASGKVPTIVLEAIPTAIAPNLPAVPNIEIDHRASNFTISAVPTIVAAKLPAANLNIPNQVNQVDIPSISVDIPNIPNVPTLNLPTLPSAPSLPATNGNNTASVAMPELPPLPAVVVPNIPAAPSVGSNGSGVSFDLAPIPEVAVPPPQPVASSKSSR